MLTCRRTNNLEIISYFDSDLLAIRILEGLHLAMFLCFLMNLFLGSVISNH